MGAACLVVLGLLGQVPRDVAPALQPSPSFYSLPNTFELTFSRFSPSMQAADASPGQKKKTSDCWFGGDKVQHALVSTYLTFFIYQVNREIFDEKKSEARVVAVTTTFFIGTAKETYDRTVRRTRFSLKDLVADGVGIAFGLWATTW